MASASFSVCRRTRLETVTGAVDDDDDDEDIAVLLVADNVDMVVIKSIQFLFSTNRVHPQSPKLCQEIRDNYRLIRIHTESIASVATLPGLA